MSIEESQLRICLAVLEAAGERNSWVLGLEHVDARELVEAQLVNAIAPAMLCSRLRPLLDRSRFARSPRRQRVGGRGAVRGSALRRLAAAPRGRDPQRLPQQDPRLIPGS
jgi:hypothetical protein